MEHDFTLSAVSSQGKLLRCCSECLTGREVADGLRLGLFVLSDDRSSIVRVADGRAVAEVADICEDASGSEYSGFGLIEG